MLKPLRSDSHTPNIDARISISKCIVLIYLLQLFFTTTYLTNSRFSRSSIHINNTVVVNDNAVETSFIYYQYVKCR